MNNLLIQAAWTPLILNTCNIPMTWGGFGLTTNPPCPFLNLGDHCRTVFLSILDDLMKSNKGLL